MMSGWLTVHASVPLAGRGVIRQRQPAKPCRHEVVVPVEEEERLLEQDLEERVEELADLAQNKERDPDIEVKAGQVDFFGQLTHCIPKAMGGKLLTQ